MVGESGCGKTVLFEAIRQLNLIARGGSAAATYGIWSEVAVSELAVVIDLPDGRLATYEVRVHQIGLVASVISECLFVGRTKFLWREGQEFVFAQDGLRRDLSGHQRYSIRASEFALGAVRVEGAKDPIADMKGHLLYAWTLSPDPNVMTSVLDQAIPRDDVACRCLASYFVARQQMLPELYGAVLANVTGNFPSISGFSVETDNFGGRYLAVHRSDDSTLRGMPIESLSQGEKIFLLAAFVSAVNRLSGPLICFWDSPLNWLGKSAGARLAQLLYRSFRAQGQVVVFSSERDEIKWMSKTVRIDNVRTKV